MKFNESRDQIVSNFDINASENLNIEDSNPNFTEDYPMKDKMITEYKDDNEKEINLILVIGSSIILKS